MRIFSFLLSIAFLTLISCSKDDNHPGQNDLSYTMLKKADFANVNAEEGRVDVVVQNQDELDELILHYQIEDFDAAIDFNMEQVVFIGTELKTNSPYSLTVKNITEHDGMISVKIHETSPSGVVVPAFSRPYIIFKMAKKDKNLVVEWE